MRLIWTTTNQDEADQLCRSLAQNDISYSLDVKKETDWNNESYGSFVFSVWVQEESDLEKAKELISSLTPSLVTPPPSTSIPKSPIAQFLQVKLHTKIPSSPVLDRRKAPCTFFLFLLCVFLFVIDGYKDVSSPSHFASPTAFSRVRKGLFFDYPASTKILDSFLEEKASPSPAEALTLQGKLNSTPSWEGLYPHAVAAFTHVYQNVPPFAGTPVVEKIRVGEIWRVITPALLHSSLLHLLFNMSWLLGLGKQIERRISSKRYLLLIAILAAVSNTAQYIMSGPFFLGFSGVVCGFVGFIMARQTVAPWESYLFSRATGRFLLWFIGASAALAVVGFLQECAGVRHVGEYFANTAHLVGLAAGWLLGKNKVFRMTEST
jgi:GlpG protein